MKKSFLILTILLRFVTYSYSQSGSDIIKVSVISESYKVIPGKEIYVGLKMQIQPDWHTYWINPGESGLAPKIEWFLPDGFIIGELIYPFPEKFNLDGIINYGYEKETMLLAKLKFPEFANTEKSYEIKAKVKWLVCKDGCLPGEGEISLKFNESSDEKMSAFSAKQIKDYLQKVPSKNHDFITEAEISGENVNFTITTPKKIKEKIKKIELFPVDEEILIDNSINPSVKKNNAFIILAKSSNQKKADFINVVLVVTTEKNKKYSIASKINMKGKHND